jgi:hypothetical protein
VRTRLGLLVLAALGSLGAPPPLPAQGPSPAHFESWRPAEVRAAVRKSAADSAFPSANGSGMILGGVTGFVLGYAIGGLVGSAIESGEDDLGAAIFGGAVVSSFTIPLGVHLGNHSRGNVLDDLLASAVIGFAGIGIAAATNDGVPLLLTSLTQVIASSWLEERATRKPAPPDASH